MAYNATTGMWEPGGDGPARRPGSDLEGIQNARGPIAFDPEGYVMGKGCESCPAPEDMPDGGSGGVDPAKMDVDPKKPPPGGYNRDGTENAEYNGDNGKSMFEFFANSDRPTNGEDGGNPADPDDKPAPAGIGGSTNGAGELAKPSPFRVYSADGVPISEKRERQFDRRLKRMSRKDGPKGNTADRVRDGSVRIYDTSHLVVRETPTGPVYEIPGTNGARTTQGDPIAVGWYIPGSDIVAIDLEKMKKDPFGMEKTVVHEVNHAVNGDDPTGRAEQFDVEARAAWVADVADSPESGVGADGRTDRERDAVAKVLAGYEDLASAFATDLAFQAYVNGWRIDRNDNLDNSAPEAK